MHTHATLLTFLGLPRAYLPSQISSRASRPFLSSTYCRSWCCDSRCAPSRLCEGEAERRVEYYVTTIRRYLIRRSDEMRIGVLTAVLSFLTHGIEGFQQRVKCLLTCRVYRYSTSDNLQPHYCTSGSDARHHRGKFRAGSTYEQ